MELSLIYGGAATLEDLYELHDRKGLEFVIEDGKITAVHGRDEKCISQTL